MFGRHFDDKDMVISKVGSILAMQKIVHYQDFTHFLSDLARVDRRVQGLVQRRPSEKWLGLDGGTQETFRDPVILRDFYLVWN